MSEWRPYRLALLATSTRFAHRPRAAGEANIPQTEKPPPCGTGEGDRKAVEGVPWTICGFLA